MTEPVVDSANPGTDASGNSTQEPKETDKVDYSKYRELLDEKKKVQVRERELASKVEAYEKAQKDKEEDAAKKRGDYESLIKTREDEIAKLKAENDSNRERNLQIKKVGSFLKTAGEDIDQKWLRLVDPNEIIINPETGEVDQMSVAKAVDTFKKTWPEAFKKPGARFPADAPNGSSGMINESEWKKLKVADMKKYRPNQINYGQ